MSYNPDGGQFPKFEAIGNRIVFFGAYATDRGLNELAGSRQFSPHFYISENTFDFTEIDRILEMIAPGGVGAYIIPRVYFPRPFGGNGKIQKSAPDSRPANLPESAMLPINGARICGKL